MKLDMGEQARDRPVPLTISETIKDQKQIKSEMKKACELDADKMRSGQTQWNIESSQDSAGLEGLMSQLTLAQNQGDAPTTNQRVDLLHRLARLVLSRAEGRDIKKLAGMSSEKSTAEFVRQLRTLIENLSVKDARRQKGDKEKDDNPDADVSRQSAKLPVNLTACKDKGLEKTRRFEERNKKKDVIKDLKDEDDLCPRSPMRLQHDRPNNFPYQNTSRKHHSGGYMSTVAYSDPISPTPQYHNHLDTLSCVASSPPLVIESSNVPNETTMNSFVDLGNLSDVDLQVLQSVVADFCASSTMDLNEANLIPESISEINSSQIDAFANFLKQVEQQVPTHKPTPVEQDIVEELLTLPGTLDTAPYAWRSYPDDSTSGYSSLSPNSVLSSSPGGSHVPLSPDSGHVVPDDSNDVPNLVSNMSPSGHFFDDNVPFATNYNLNVNIYANDLGSFDGGCSPGSVYSSTSTPSPSVYPSSNVDDQNPQDFETKCQIASNDYLCSLEEVFDAENLLPEFENDFSDFTAALNASSQPNHAMQDYIPTSTSSASGHVSTYPSNVVTSTPANAQAYDSSENAILTNFTLQFDNHSTVHGSPNTAPPDTNFTDNSDLAKDIDNLELYGQPTFSSLLHGSNNGLPPQFSPSYTAGGATYIDSTPSTVNAPNLQLGVLVPVMQARLVSPPTSNLKRLKPKVERSLRTESGKERILKLMDEKKKAEAWVKISLKLKEAAEKDEDGDTQLMILCANAQGNIMSYVLEYIYALVEMLKGIPNSLSAVNNQQHSALYLAALHSDYTNRAVVVRYIADNLIELGEDINYINEGGNSMLHELCHQGDQRYDVLIEFLSLKNKAGQPYFDVNKYNADGKTALHVAASSHGVNGTTCLKTVQLLVAEQADLSLPEKTRLNTALHLAILHSGAPSLIQALLCGPSQAGGRACNMLNCNRDSPLHCAASRNDLSVEQQMKVIQLLLDPKHGAVKSLNASGKFPIALVADERRQEIRRVYETRKGNQGYGVL